MILRAIVFALIASPAMAFTASNDLVVHPASAGQFSVPANGQSEPRAFWCAAGDYVLRGLGQGPQTRIYRTSALPRATGQGMDFSLDASQSAGKTGLLWVKPDDGGMSAALAQSFCAVADAPNHRL